MKRCLLPQRSTLNTRALSCGFDLHHRTEGQDIYWQEGVYWQLHLQELEQWLLPSARSIYGLLMAYVDRACCDCSLLMQAEVSEHWWPLLWRERLSIPKALLIRLDLAYNGEGPPKLLECEVEAPGSIFETGFFQLQWFEELREAGALPAGATQWNRLHDALVEAFADLQLDSRPLHVAAARDDSEDWLQARYLSACASQAGHCVRLIERRSIRQVHSGALFDSSGDAISHLLFLQRWHQMISGAGQHGLLLALEHGLNLLAPVWCHLLSSKSSLVGLWQMFPEHPLLLRASLHPTDGQEPGLGQVRKPLHGHRGEGLVLFTGDGTRISTTCGHDPGERSSVIQQFAPQCLAAVGGNLQGSCVISCWLVDGEPVALGVREASEPVVTGSNCRFVPHIVLP